MQRFNFEYKHPFLSALGRTFLPTGAGDMDMVKSPLGLPIGGLNNPIEGFNIGSLTSKLVPFAVNYLQAKNKPESNGYSAGFQDEIPSPDDPEEFKRKTGRYPIYGLDYRN
jgi:hypothetical protein